MEWSAGADHRGQVRQTPGGSCTARLGDGRALLSSKGTGAPGQWVRPGQGAYSPQGGGPTRVPVTVEGSISSIRLSPGASHRNGSKALVVLTMRDWLVV